MCKRKEGKKKKKKEKEKKAWAWRYLTWPTSPLISMPQCLLLLLDFLRDSLKAQRTRAHTHTPSARAPRPHNQFLHSSVAGSPSCLLCCEIAQSNSIDWKIERRGFTQCGADGWLDSSALQVTNQIADTRNVGCSVSSWRTGARVRFIKRTLQDSPCPAAVTCDGETFKTTSLRYPRLQRRFSSPRWARAWKTPYRWPRCSYLGSL